jgi:hypothetical protein
MRAHIDDATASFLRTAANDLQRQIGLSGVVERLTLDDSASGVRLVAAIRVGHMTLIELRGDGEDLVAAYRELHLNVVPELILASAFREVVNARPMA